MRPNRYPYSKPRFREVVISEERFPFTDDTFRIIALKDSWIGETVDYRHEIKKLDFS